VHNKFFRGSGNPPQAIAPLVGDHSRVAQTTKQLLLRKAAGLMGKNELATRLSVSEAMLDKWMGGGATMPDRQLIKLAGVLDTWGKAPTKPQ